MLPAKSNHQTTDKQRKLRQQALEYYNNHPATWENQHESIVLIILAIVAIAALVMVSVITSTGI